MIHRIEPSSSTLHGYFSNECPPILRIVSGDEVVSATLDSRWHQLIQPNLTSYDSLLTVERQPADKGHALVGPIWVEGAKAGQVLEVVIEDVQLSHWGWSGCGGWKSPLNVALDVCAAPTEYLIWKINKETILD